MTGRVSTKPVVVRWEAGTASVAFFWVAVFEDMFDASKVMSKPISEV